MKLAERGINMKEYKYPDLFIANMLVNDGSILKEDKYIKMATFLVREVCTKDCAIVGFAEAVTNDLVVDRRKRKYALKHGYTDLDVDAKTPFKDHPGDILWRVSKIHADRVLTNEEIEAYLSNSPEKIRYSLDFYRANTNNYIDKNNQKNLILK